jgi:hypothetical protein
MVHIFSPFDSIQPNSGLGRFHETFRLSRSRAVGRTPWTGDQLVARTVRVKLCEKLRKQIDPKHIK